MLSTPPAFILSQDQTLRKICSSVFNRLALLAWLLSIFFLCQGAAPDDSMFNVNVRLAQCKRNDTPGSNFCLHLLLDFIYPNRVNWLYFLFSLISMLSFSFKPHTDFLQIKKQRPKSSNFDLCFFEIISKKFFYPYWKHFHYPISICVYHTKMISQI